MTPIAGEVTAGFGPVGGRIRAERVGPWRSQCCVFSSASWSKRCA